MAKLVKMKALFKKGMEYSRGKFSSPLYQKYTDGCDYQMELAQSAKTESEFNMAVSIPNQIFAYGFDINKPMCDGCEFSHTGIQYGKGTLEWYFLVGIMDEYVYQITFARCAVCPEAVNDVDKTENCYWVIGGGYGTTGPNPLWYSISSEVISMTYTQPTDATFFLSGKGQTKTVKFASDIPMQFMFEISFLDQNNKSHILSSRVRANSPAVANWPGAVGGTPCGGSMYISYTDTAVSLSVNGEPEVYGTGWVDHQNQKVTIAQSLYKQAFNIVLATVAHLSPLPRWTWTIVNDFESGRQYMFTYFLTSKAWNFKVGDSYVPQMINVYKGGVPYFQPKKKDMRASDTKITLMETFDILGYNIPSKYKIVLPGGKIVYLQNVSAPNTYHTPNPAVENPSVVYDETGKKIIGSGLIEVNNYLSFEQIAKRFIEASGGEASEENIGKIKDLIGFSPSPWQKVLAFLIVLAPLVMAIFAVIFIFYSRNNRHLRLKLSVIVFMICYAILKLPLFSKICE